MRELAHWEGIKYSRSTFVLGNQSMYEERAAAGAVKDGIRFFTCMND